MDVQRAAFVLDDREHAVQQRAELGVLPFCLCEDKRGIKARVPLVAGQCIRLHPFRDKALSVQRRNRRDQPREAAHHLHPTMEHCRLDAQREALAGGDKSGFGHEVEPESRADVDVEAQAAGARVVAIGAGRKPVERVGRPRGDLPLG